ncbi:MAG: tetratricopeptide repeat protein [bacterium]
MTKKKNAKAKTSLPGYFYLIIPLVATAAFFIPVLGFDILNWDDKGYLLENPLLKDFSIFKLVTQFWMGNYHPLTMLLFTTGFKLAGLNGMFFHLVNLVFHLLNVFLVFRFVEKLVKNNLLVAMLTALLFGIHPMHIESVAWIAELKDVLYATFFLLSLNLYLKYLDHGDKLSYGLALLFFLFSLLSKGQAVVLTPAIILLDILRKRKFSKSLIVEKLPFLALSIGFGLLALKAQQSVSALSFGVVESHDNYLYGFYNYILYFLKAVYPGQMSGIHPYGSTAAAPSFLFLYPFIFLFVSAMGIWITRKTGPLSFFGFAFFVVTISIVVKFIPVGDAMIAERYTYIPYIGLFLLISLFFSSLINHPKYKIPGTILLTLYLFSLLIPGFMYLRTFKNSESYWLNTMKTYPLYWRPHYEIALYYTDINEINQAVDHNTSAISLISPINRTELANLYYNRASLFVNKLSDFSRALNDYQKVREFDSTKKDLNFNLGYCYTKLDRSKEATFYLKRLIEDDSTNGQAYYLLSFGNSRLSQYQEAYDNLGKAIRLKPDLNDAYLQRAMVCIDYLGKQDEAIKDLLFLISQGYRPEKVYLTLAICYLETGKYRDALACCDKVINLGGNKGKALYIKALALDKMNMKTEAYSCGMAAISAGFPVDPGLLNKWKPARRL